MTSTTQNLVECPNCGKQTARTPFNCTAVFDENKNWSHDEIPCPGCEFKIKTEV